MSLDPQQLPGLRDHRPGQSTPQLRRLVDARDELGCRHYRSGSHQTVVRRRCIHPTGGYRCPRRRRHGSTVRPSVRAGLDHDETRPRARRRLSRSWPRSPDCRRRGVDRRARHPAVERSPDVLVVTRTTPRSCCCQLLDWAGRRPERSKAQAGRRWWCSSRWWRPDRRRAARGISFLLKPHRLNVAGELGWHAAVIRRSATLTEYLPHTPAGWWSWGVHLWR